MSQFLEVLGAKTHNLKNIDIKIPKNKMTVITGVSGSGKSSLAFNTIYNVGQQKYLESLSSYARMFIGGMDEEAEVSEINGLSPTISIDQKTTSKNPRSTVGTITEIYDYYKLLFLNIGIRKCVVCGNVVKKDTIENIIDYINEFEEGQKFMIKSPLNKEFKSFEELKKEVLDLGFIRFSVGNKVYTVNDEINNKNSPLSAVADIPPQPRGNKISSPSMRGKADKVSKGEFKDGKIVKDAENKDYGYFKDSASSAEGHKINKNSVFIIIDRLVKKDYSVIDSNDIKRLKDSIALAYKVGKGLLEIEKIEEGQKINSENVGEGRSEIFEKIVEKIKEMKGKKFL